MLFPVILALVGAATPSDVALAPLLAERASLDEVPVYERLDATLRKAIAASAGVHLQDAEVTQRNLASARGAGVDCAGDDRVCLGKLTVLDDVEKLLLPTVKRTGNVFNVSLLVVDGKARSAEVGGLLPIEPEEAERAAVKDLVDRALHAVVIAPASAPLLKPDEAAATAAVSTSPAAAKPFPVAGAALLSAGCVVGGAGLAGALVFNELLGKPESYADRAGKLFFGQLSFGAAVLGVGTAAVGGALVALE